MFSRSLAIFAILVGCFWNSGSAIAGATVVANKSTQKSEKYVPGIWVDPDGCEHWVMDDGLEGYMTPHVTREGIPVCRRHNPCAVVNTDQLFAAGTHRVSALGRAKLRKFFREANVTSFIIDGHTDSNAGDAYNMALSQRRAKSVAKVAHSVGARTQTRWYGERVPIASNRTSGGKARNRRVEITCVK